jgi:hypothetical protein
MSPFMTSNSTSAQHHYERSDHPKLKSDRKKESIAASDWRSRAVGGLGDPSHRCSTQQKRSARGSAFGPDFL